MRNLHFPLLAAALLVLSACGSKGDKCATVTCGAGQTCDPATGSCIGGVGGGSGGGGDATGGGSSTGGGGATGGGDPDGGQGGGGGATGGGSNDGGSGGGGGAIVIVDGGTLAGGDTCLMPAVLMPNTSYASSTGPLNDDYNFDIDGECVGSLENTRDAVFQITVPPGDRLTVRVTSIFDAVVNLVAAPATNCGTTSGGMTSGITCLAGRDGPGAGGTELVQYFNTSTMPRTVFILVDGFEAGDDGAFSISAVVNPPPPSDSCFNAVPLTMQLANESWDGYGNDFPSSPLTCNFGNGPDRVFFLSVPPLTRVTLRATPSDSDISMNIVEGPAAACAAPFGCNIREDEGGPGDPENLVFNNGSTATRTVYLLVSLYGTPAANETFSLTSIFSTIPPAPLGDVCSTATVLSPGTLMGQTTRGYYHDYRARCVNGLIHTPGADRVYAMTVNPGQTLTATVTPEVDGGSWNPGIYLVSGHDGGCAPVYLSCLASQDFGSTGDPDSISYRSDGGVTQVFIIIDAFDKNDVGEFRLQTTLTP